MSDVTDQQPREGLRLLHTMLRVVDLKASIQFYCERLGMQLLREEHYPEGRFTIAFVGYGPEESQTVIELTDNWGREQPYPVGEAFGHVAIGANDIHALYRRLADAGVSVLRPPGPMKGGTAEIAFVADPDGYRIELVQVPSIERPAP